MLDATPRQAAADALRAARSDRAAIEPLVARLPGIDTHTLRSSTVRRRRRVGGRDQLIERTMVLAGRGDDSEARSG